MRRTNLLLLIVMAWLSFGCSSASVSDAGNEHQNELRLDVRGTRLVNEKGEAVVLQGVSYGWHNWWPRFYNAATVNDFARNWNCSVVRAAMGVEPDGAYLQQPQAAKDCVIRVADAAIANGIYVIIDWHSHGIQTEAAKVFFQEMATRYRGVPNVIYEIFNEPVEDSWESVKQYSEEVIGVIRAIDPRALILVGSPHWDQDVHLAADNPITGYQNILYTLHFYAATHGESLRQRADYALSRGLPLFVSECAGMEASGDGPVDTVAWKQWREWMQKHNISWIAWSVSDKDETCSMLKPEASSLGGWPDTDLKPWAKLVRTELTGR